ncbi:MAG: ATPase, T2SS/T4P/T4SS family, partial [Candidatus Doudnabacteria bacterium]|nr:ATPase, T2SS/T4P/T4SS family [Candidatus Doudnabacteria bacterium]
MDRSQLNEALKQKKILTQDKLEALEKDRQQVKGVISWEDFLLEKKALSEEQLLTVKAGLLNVEPIDLRNQPIAQDVLNLVPEPIAQRHKVISFAKTKDELSLAMADPDDLQTKEFIQKKTGLKIRVFLIGKTGLEFGLSKYHSNLEKEIKHLFAPSGKPPEEKKEQTQEDINEGLKKMAEEIPVIRVVDTLMEYAVYEKASDIHIEPQENAVIVRYRIDGVLHDVMTLPKVIQAAIIARIKVLSNL